MGCMGPHASRTANRSRTSILRPLPECAMICPPTYSQMHTGHTAHQTQCCVWRCRRHTEDVRFSPVGSVCRHCGIGRGAGASTPPQQASLTEECATLVRLHMCSCGHAYPACRAIRMSSRGDKNALPNCRSLVIGSLVVPVVQMPVPFCSAAIGVVCVIPCVRSSLESTQSVVLGTKGSIVA